MPHQYLINIAKMDNKKIRIALISRNKDHNFITCIVKWKKTQLANDKQMVGLGTKFEKISKKQKIEILEILKNAQP